MKIYIACFLLMLLITLPFSSCAEKDVVMSAVDEPVVTLPEPSKDSDTSIEEALAGRRSTRNFNDEAVTLKQLGQLLWAAQGITGDGGKRTAPSAGALYPLKVYVVAGKVEGVTPGVYLYEPGTHTMTRLLEGDLRPSLAKAALGQTSVSQAAFNLVITGKYEIVTSKYNERGVRFTHLEAGHAAQNVCLQAVGLSLGAVTVGAFDDAGVQKVLGLEDDETPFYIIPVGHYSD